MVICSINTFRIASDAVYLRVLFNESLALLQCFHNFQNMSIKSNLSIKQFDLTLPNCQPLTQQQVKQHTKGRAKKLAAKKGLFVAFQILLRYFDQKGQAVKDGAGDKLGLFINIGNRKDLEIHFSKKEEKGKGLTKRKDDTATGQVGVEDRNGTESLVFKVSDRSKMKNAGWKEVNKALKKYIPGYNIVIEHPGGTVETVEEETTDPNTAPNTDDPQSDGSTEAPNTSTETTDPENTTNPTETNSTDTESSDPNTDTTSDPNTESSPQDLQSLKPIIQNMQDLFKSKLPNVVKSIKERGLTPEDQTMVDKALEDAQQLLSTAVDQVGPKLKTFLENFKQKQHPQLEQIQKQVTQQLEEYQAVEEELKALQEELKKSEGVFDGLIKDAPNPKENTSTEPTEAPDTTEPVEEVETPVGNDSTQSL